MFKFNRITKEDIKKRNPNWSELPNHPYKILIVGGLESRKTNASFNLLHHEPDIDKFFLHAKDPYEAKHELLINIRETV